MKSIFLPRALFGYAAGLSLMAVSVSAAALDLNVADTKASLYGFVSLDMIYDVDSDLGPLFTPDNIGRGTDGHFRASGYRSRLGVSTLTEMEKSSDLKTVIEGDFFGSGGGNFRLRHAYGEWNGILAGKTWTNFPGFTGIYPTVDFRVPVGTSNTRQAQLRYTTGKLSLALEEPGKLGGRVIDKITKSTGGAADNIFDGSTSVVAAGAKNQMPDFTVRYASNGPTSYHASAVLRNLSVDNGSTVDDSAFGWGVALGLAQEVTKALTLRGSLVYGDGVGGYINLNPAAPAYVTSKNKVETIKAIGGTLAASYKIGPGAITLGTAIAKADWDDAVKDGLLGAVGANEEIRSTHLNYIWSPVNKITFGAEVAYHERELWNGDSADAVRLQGMVQYSF